MKKALVLCSLICILAVTDCLAAGSKPTFSLRSRREAGQTDRVVVLMEVAGSLKQRVDGKTQRTSMSGVDRLTYQEMTIDATGGRLRALRHYEKADSTVKFKDDSLQCSLSPERRLIGATVDLPTASLFSPNGPLGRDELEVIDILGNSLLLDNLLPEAPTAEGQSWKLTDKTMAALLGLESAGDCDVRCTLTEVTDTVARFEISGRIEGSINDTSSKIVLKGKYRFDRRTGRIDWFALLTNEDRKPSQVADGFEVTVKLQMTVTQQEPCQELVDASAANLKLEPTPELTRLGYQPPGSHWRLSHDRQWYLGSDDRDAAVLRRIDSGAVVAQCNASSLRRNDPNKLVSLAEFQSDVRQALGKNFGEFVQASESVTPTKYRILRVVVSGTFHNKSGDIPIRWIYYHVADQVGRQAALTFTVQQENLERFADADKSLVDSLEFLEPAKKAKNERLGMRQ